MTTTTHQSAEQFMRDYIRRTNTHRFDEVAPVIAENATFWFSSGSYHGLAAIRAAFEKTWGMIQDEVYGVEDVVWPVVTESSAVCLYTFRWQGNINGEAREGSGRGTNVLRREDGRWRVVHEHLSPHPQ